MSEFDRVLLREELCTILQSKYVALLGQRCSGLKTVVNALINKRSPFVAMKFISIALPRNIENGEEFEEMLLTRLQEAAYHIPPGQALADRVAQAVQQHMTYSANFRVRIALDILGKETSLNHLVIILHALAEISEKPLKNLLLMLREYHDQKNNSGAAGEKLRFLVVGGERLWRLCYYKTPERSPFNIAQRIFLDGLSLRELQKINSSRDTDTAIMLRSLTGGVPVLVDEAMQSVEDPDDLTPYFGHLQDAWNAISSEAQDALLSVVEAPEQLPLCRPDYQCPQIPVIKSPWQEAFWAGFLQMRYRQLAWRSQVHQAFVTQYVQSQEASSRSTIVKMDLRDRTERLERALSHAHYSRNKQEPFAEAQALAWQTYNNELATAIEMVQCGEKSETVLRRVEQIAALSERDWLRELVKEAPLHKEMLDKFLLEAVVTRANHFLSVQFDVFLCHNGKDKAEVKEIGKQLKDKGILPWLDEWELPPGQPWQRLLEQQIAQIKSAAVFVGQHGIGPWQREELDVWLREFNKRGCPVIPVFLMSAPEEMEPPTFLTNRIWVDFRKQDSEPMERLIWGITGKHGMH